MFFAIVEKQVNDACEGKVLELSAAQTM